MSISWNNNANPEPLPTSQCRGDYDVLEGQQVYFPETVLDHLGLTNMKLSTGPVDKKVYAEVRPLTIDFTHSSSLLCI